MIGKKSMRNKILKGDFEKDNIEKQDIQRS